MRQIYFFWVFFLGQSGEASQGRVCYQRGLPRLVYERLSSHPLPKMYCFVILQFCSGVGRAVGRGGRQGPGEVPEEGRHAQDQVREGHGGLQCRPVEEWIHV